MSNTTVRFPVHRVRLKLLAVCVALSVSVGWVLWQLQHRKINDQELLRAAVEEWKRAGGPGAGPDYQIFEQQAAQGYYEDAQATAALFTRSDDKRWSVEELAKIRSENGDVDGAKATIKRFAGSDLWISATRKISLAQVGNGDLKGALETAAPVAYHDDVLLAFARQQIAKSDLNGALDTAQRMNSDPAQVFYEIGSALQERGEQGRARELASQISNRKVAVEFTKCVRITLWPREVEVRNVLDRCGPAYSAAAAGRFDEADSIVEQNKCPYIWNVTTLQYPVDPAGAEHLLRMHPDQQSMAIGLTSFASLAASKGNVSEALRFYNEVQQLTSADRPYQLAREVARGWTIKDGPNAVLQWATSRPTLEQRTWALIGMAEALGHSRSQKIAP